MKNLHKHINNSKISIWIAIIIVSGLYINVTGALSKNTKYQTEEHSKFVVVARSKETNEIIDAPALPKYVKF